jgi:pheromone a factor receptor
MADTTINPHPFTLTSIYLPLFALVAILLSLPPLIWHAKNKNIAATCLIFWLILLNTNNFLNPLIWPTDDWAHAWMGRGYCDTQIRIIVGAINGAIPACVLAISRALAKALNTKRQVVSHDRRSKMREMVFEGVLGLGVPTFFMVAYWFVQDVRYYILPIYGCDGGFDASWVSVVMFFVPPVIMALISAYYTSKPSFPSSPYTSFTNLLVLQSWSYTACIPTAAK